MGLADELSWNGQGLVPAIVVHAHTGVTLMMAWMNRESFELTLKHRKLHFWSRSRKSLWKKGESSGNVLTLVDLRLDCDGDTLLARAIPAGPACHTGKDSCFHRQLDEQTQTWAEDQGPQASEAGVIPELYERLNARRNQADGKRSYTSSLLEKGANKLSEKILEEAQELVDEIESGSQERLVSESADLLYHCLVTLLWRDTHPDMVFKELRRRFAQSGHEEKATRGSNP